jgi:hypothetical protein
MRRDELSVSGVAQLRACLGSLGLTPAQHSSVSVVASEPEYNEFAEFD